MDEATLSKLMGTYGAPVTARNANIAREFFASNPDYAERRANGMRGSIQEDNTDLLGPMLEKFMQDTAAAPATGAPAQLQPQQTMPTVQAASAPTRKNATAAPAPAMGPNLPMASGAVNPLDAPPAQQPVQRNGSFWDDVLTALLGTTSVAGAAAMRNRGGAAPAGGAPNAAPGTPEATFVGRMGEAARNHPAASGYLQNPRPQIEDLGTADQRYNESGKTPRTGSGEQGKLPAPNKQITSQRPDGNYESTGKEVEGVNARRQAEKTARKDVLQKEIDSENESARTLQEQMRKRAKDEAATADLVKKAKRATGRK